MKFYCEVNGHIWIFGSLSSLQKVMNLAIGLQMSILTFLPWIVEFKGIYPCVSDYYELNNRSVAVVLEFIQKIFILTYGTKIEI